MSQVPDVLERPTTGTPPAPRRGVQLLRAVGSWWPVGLSVLLGLVLWVQARGLVGIDPAVEALVRMVFVTSVAGAVLASFLRFVTWWFWTRRQP